MKNLSGFIWVIVQFMTIHLAAQNPPYFDHTISRATLETYLAKSAFFDHVNNACYYGFSPAPTPPCLVSPDQAMLSKLKPLYLARASSTWGGHDWVDFEDDSLLALKIHSIDSNIIIGAFLSEFLGKDLVPPPAPGDHIKIPDYVKSVFNYTGNAEYFDYRQMVYSDVAITNPCAANPSHVWCDQGVFQGITPNMNQVMTKMYYYYVARRLINAKYGAISIGQWDLLNDEDPHNAAIWDVFSKIRSYANGLPGSYRHLILITGSSVTDNLARGTETDQSNNLPYYNYSSGNTSNQLLFDFMENTVRWLEDGYVANSASPFYRNLTEQRYERLVKPPSDLSIFQFGGTTPQTWQSPSQVTSLPYILHLDVGGPNINSEEGQLYYDNSLGPASSRTWGWGGELSYYMYTTLPYRRHLLHVTAHQLRDKSSGNGYLMMPFRGPVSSHYFRFPSSSPYVIPTSAGGAYNYTYDNNPSTTEVGFVFCANNEATPPTPPVWCSVAQNVNDLFCYPANASFNIEDQVQEIWNKTSEVNFCTPTTFTGDFTEAQGFNSPDYPRFLIDVDGDGDKDIVGIGSNSIRVSLYTYAFQPSTVWTTNTLTTAGGWNSASHLRTTGDFNGDQKQDLIGFGPGGVWVGLSTGSAFVFTRWTTDFGNTNNTTDEWANSKSVRVVADINGDMKDDIVGFGNMGTYRAISNGTGAFGSKTHWYWDFSNNGGYNNTDHIRMVVDINNDGYPDLVAFGETGVYAALNSYSSGQSVISGSSTLLLNNLCKGQGWSTTRHTRRFADMNGDGWLDIVAFGNEGVLISKNTKSTSAGFATPAYWTYQFGNSTRAGGWNNTDHVRLLADVNGDSKQDVVAFGQSGLNVMLSMGDYFTNIFHYPNFGNLPAYGGWKNTAHLRTAANFDGDARSEICCFGQNSVFILNNCGVTFKPVNGNDDAPTDLAFPSSADFKMYPNPVLDVLRVTVDTSTEFTNFTVLDPFGRALVSYERNPDREFNLQLEVGHLAPGIYLLAMHKGDQVLKTKAFAKLQ